MLSSVDDLEKDVKDLAENDKKITFHKNDTLVEGHFIDIDNNGNAIINIDSKETLISSGILEIS